jgi:DNA polymerase III alpha subunit
MNYNAYGQVFTTAEELYNLLYRNPDADLTKFLVKDPLEFNSSVEQLHYDHAKLGVFKEPNISIAEFDAQQQKTWYMPKDYLNLDIAALVLGQCKTEQELQRVGQELLLYQERDLFNLLRYLKYLVDTLRKNNIVWGVGRGSSVASYVLYLIGVHKINSLKYELDIDEFLK